MRPVFTPNFIAGLTMLDEASLTDDESTRKTAIVKFLKEFGTHFMERTSLGSELIYEHIFTTTASSKEERENRQKCVKSEAEGSVSGGGFGAELSASLGVGTGKCEESATDSAFEESESSEISKTIARGSRPKDLSNWVDADFTPVPIHRELQTMTELFQTNWLGKDIFYGFEKSLNGQKMKELFDEYVTNNPEKVCELLMNNFLNKDCTPKSKYAVYIVC